MPRLISDAEERVLHRAVNAGCPFHNGKGTLCLHLVLGKLFGLAATTGRWTPHFEPEDVK